MGQSSLLKDQLRTLALDVGFNLVGFTDSSIESEIKDAYDTWLLNKQHASMDYMKRTQEMRKDSSLLLPGVQSIIVVALSYVPMAQPVCSLAHEHDGEGCVALYARSRDYHHVFKGMMKKFDEQAQQMFEQNGIRDAQLLAACDTKPVFEKYFAYKAGLGFIGRNSLLITKEFGSYVMLGCFLTTVPIEPDVPFEGTCGNCTRCLDACPTKALVGPRTLDSSKCIAYWTIEHRGEFPVQAPPLFGNMFGCDICQVVCPYNKKALGQDVSPLRVRRVDDVLNVGEMLSLSEQEFRLRYSGTPLMRAGYSGMQRNAKKLNRKIN
ncbi:tRNA epoxyqueuosine(34) reductase QueG [Candidatus Woesearchaeota archaeon]|nr:tRNA epoxyqueuosine(34) reductase QueG [Candidatus Woesearchaeota archaeon]